VAGTHVVPAIAASGPPRTRAPSHRRAGSRCAASSAD